jgi:hypothetical protein
MHLLLSPIPNVTTCPNQWISSNPFNIWQFGRWEDVGATRDNIIISELHCQQPTTLIAPHPSPKDRWIEGLLFEVLIGEN